MIDIHVHYGQFREEYYPPVQVIASLRTTGINQIGLMPFINKNGDNIFMSHQTMVELITKNRDFIIPILWIHPSTSLSSITKMTTELPYKIIKIHGYIHDWHKHQIKFQKIITFAKDNKLPIMIHTGGRKESFAYSYKKICKYNPENIFILAHSRPAKGAINVLKNCPNVYCDIAFTPIKDLKLILKSGLEDRVLFGTDYPIKDSFDEGLELDKFYNKIISKLKLEFGEEIFKKITEDNFTKLFG